MINSPTRPRNPAIAAIIPTYNEQENIATVLKVLRDTEIIDEIILVDDGSQDRTVEIAMQAAAQDARIHIIRHEKNMGKGQAVFTGSASTKAPFILMLDADLKDLTPGHLRALIAPVLDRRADMTLGLFWNGRIITDLSHWATPFLTGQRGLRADILKHISRQAAAGYGFEVALTVAARQHGYRTRFVPLNGVWHLPSEVRSERGGIRSGILWRFRMFGQIIRAFYIATLERYPSAKAFFSTDSKG